jgi:hypothetical protein
MENNDYVSVKWAEPVLVIDATTTPGTLLGQIEPSPGEGLHFWRCADCNSISSPILGPDLAISALKLHRAQPSACEANAARPEKSRPLHRSEVEAAPDPVDHPSHYTAGGIETIDAIEAWGLDFNLGNVVKYVSRAGKKDPAAEVVDLRKAAWYLQRAISARRDR